MNTLDLIIMAHGGDSSARNKLVADNAGLVWSIVRRFIGRGCDTEDLFQIGNIGLMKAIDKFDISYEVCFSTYAVPMIAGEIKRFLRDDGMIKVSRTLKEAAGKIRAARERLETINGHEPTLKEISAEINMSEEEIVLAIESGAEVESIYKQVSQNDGKEMYLIDKLPADDDESERITNLIALRDQLDKLNDRERAIIKLRYFEEKTQMEVAKVYGVSQVQVSRLEKAILKKLREQLC